jgi:hypothetical protein
MNERSFFRWAGSAQLLNNFNQIGEFCSLEAISVKSIINYAELNKLTYINTQVEYL